MNEQQHHDEFYGGDAQTIHASALFGYLQERTAVDFLRRTGATRNHRVLSLGCGDGAIERLLAPHVAEIVGMDISSVAVDRANSQARAHGLANVRFESADLCDPPSSDAGHFDVVAGFGFLHHLPDEAIYRVMHAARQRLNGNGVFYSTDPNVYRVVRLFAALVRRSYDRYHSPDERELDPSALRKIARQAGFSQTQVRCIDYFLGPVAWVMPGLPNWLIKPLGHLDRLLAATPILRRVGSSFSLVARSA